MPKRFRKLYIQYQCHIVFSPTSSLGNRLQRAVETQKPWVEKRCTRFVFTDTESTERLNGAARGPLIEKDPSMESFVYWSFQGELFTKAARNISFSWLGYVLLPTPFYIYRGQSTFKDRGWAGDVVGRGGGLKLYWWVWGRAELVFCTEWVYEFIPGSEWGRVVAGCQ